MLISLSDKFAAHASLYSYPADSRSLSMNIRIHLLLPVALLTLAACIAHAQQAPPPPAAGARPAGARPPMDPAVRQRMTELEAGDQGPDAAAVLKLERDIEAATVAGDVAFVKAHLADNFIMIHGDSWTFGKPIQLADTKDSYLKKVENKNYLARNIAQSKVELHGNIAITTGLYVAENAPGGTPRSWFSVWYERIFEKRDGQWYFVSHRTTNGPNYGPDAASVTALIDQNRTAQLNPRPPQPAGAMPPAAPKP